MVACRPSVNPRTRTGATGGCSLGEPDAGGLGECDLVRDVGRAERRRHVIDQMQRLREHKTVVGVLRQLFGHAEIGDAARERRATGAVGPGTHTEHRIVDTSISFESPDTAEAVSRWEFVVETDVAPRRTSEGRYVDVFRLVEGDWLLAERTISVG